MLEAFAITDVGLVRKTNEDSFICNEQLRLFVVADGMGGHSAGEVASRLALEALEGFVRRSHADTELSWPYGIDPGMSFAGNRLRTAVHLANRRVFRAAEGCDDYSGMGTTLTAALVADGMLVYGHVGDSRLYSWHAGKFTQITRDDSWVASILASEPTMNPADLARHPMRHVLTNVIGARDQVEVQLAELELVRGVRFLICSDGLHGMVDEETLARLVGADESLQTIGGRLVQAAKDGGGHDNITAVLMRYTGEP